MPPSTLNKKFVKDGHVGIKGGSSLVNHLVDQAIDKWRSTFNTHVTNLDQLFV